MNPTNLVRHGDLQHPEFNSIYMVFFNSIKFLLNRDREALTGFSLAHQLDEAI